MEKHQKSRESTQSLSDAAQNFIRCYQANQISKRYKHIAKPLKTLHCNVKANAKND